MTAGNHESRIRNPRRGRDGRAAFTLIEILLAIGVLALGITAVLFLFTMGARSHRRAIDRTRAALLAETVVHQIQAGLRADSNPEDINAAAHTDFPGFYYDVTFTPVPNTTHYYKVKVVVRWGDRNAPVDERNSQTYETVLRQNSS